MPYSIILMATRFTIEEEGNSEDSLELNSIQSLVLESLKSNRYSRISFSIDVETSRVHLSEILESVVSNGDRIQELISYYKWSSAGKFAHSMVQAEDPSPECVYEQLIEIKLLIKSGLSHLEHLDQSVNEIFQIISAFLLFEVNLPDFPDFQVPQSSLTDSLDRMLNEVDVTKMIGTIFSKESMQILINCASQHILMFRRYNRRVKHIFNTYFRRRISSEVISVKEDLEFCLGKVAEFGTELESSEVSTKLKSTNTWLEFSISEHNPVALVSLKHLYQTYEQFRISFESFRAEDYNKGKSREQLFTDMEMHALSRGLISPIMSSLKCSSETAWHILKHLHSLITNRESIQCEQHFYHLSISSDNEID